MIDYAARAREALAGYRPRRIDAPGLKPAAVLLLLVDHGAEQRIVLTVRSSTVEHHKGQISFPGGAVHPADENLGVTALRETWEEVGVPPEAVELIGQLDDLMTISNFVVTPYAGVLRAAGPYEYTPSAVEVAEVIEPPVAALLAPGALVWEELSRGAATRRSPAYHWEGYRIWGATGRMLHGFLELVEGRGAPERAGNP